MNIEVGSHEAKTKLPELLRGVQAGNQYTIIQRGEAMACLVPLQHSKHSDAAAEAMLKFMTDRASVNTIDIRTLLDDGRG